VTRRDCFPATGERPRGSPVPVAVPRRPPCSAHRGTTSPGWFHRVGRLPSPAPGRAPDAGVPLRPSFSPARAASGTRHGEAALGPLVDRHQVRDQPALDQGVQGPGGLALGDLDLIPRDLERQLPPGRGADHDAAAAQHAERSAVRMAADDAACLRVAGQKLLEPRAVLRRQADLVHRADARGDRRVVHRHQRRQRGLGRELRLEPGAVLEVEPPLHAPRHRGVAGDEPHIAQANRVAEGLARAPGRDLQGEVLAHGVAVVVVSGQHVDGQLQRRQELAHPLVLARARLVDQIARDQHRREPVGLRAQRPHHRRQRLRRLAVARADADVRVGDLGDQGRLGHRARTPLAGPSRPS